MQLVNASRDSLLTPVQAAFNITERKSPTVPILANFLLTNREGVLHLLAYDAELQISTGVVPCAAAFEGTTVEARKIHDILRSIPADGAVKMSLTKERLTVQSGKSRFYLKTLPADQFPTMTYGPESASVITLAQKQLASLLDQVYFAMAHQDIRFYLNGMLLSVKDTTVTVVATDGHRMACATSDTEQALPEFQCIIPRKTVLELRRLLGTADDPVVIEASAAQIRFQFAGMDLVSKLIDGKYPDYHRVIPRPANELSVSRAGLLQALQRAAIVCSGKCRAIRCEFSQGALALNTSNEEAEESSDEVDITYAGPAMTIRFNLDYLTEVLMNLRCDTVRIGITDGGSSVLLRSPEGDSFRYVAMPLKE